MALTTDPWLSLPSSFSLGTQRPRLIAQTITAIIISSRRHPKASIIILQSRATTNQQGEQMLLRYFIIVDKNDHGFPAFDVAGLISFLSRSAVYSEGYRHRRL
jgi:hypothetical protein